LTLNQCRPGDRVVIRSIEDGEVRVQALRLGIDAGVEVCCRGVLPGGPVILGRGQHEIAVGNAIARRIRVRLLPATGGRA
jgi:ferrous iron transport protein A